MLFIRIIAFPYQLRAAAIDITLLMEIKISLVVFSALFLYAYDFYLRSVGYI